MVQTVLKRADFLSTSSIHTIGSTLVDLQVPIRADLYVYASLP